MSLSFEKRERQERSGEFVVFRARDGNELVICRVSTEALEDCFGGDTDILAAFDGNREEIEAAAAKLFAEGNFLTEEGRKIVMVRREDL